MARHGYEEFFTSASANHPTGGNYFYVAFKRIGAGWIH